MEIHRLFRKDRLRREGEGVALYVLLPQDMDALKVVSMSQPCAGFCLKYHIAPQWYLGLSTSFVSILRK